jgi:hypothetical protein
MIMPTIRPAKWQAFPIGPRMPHTHITDQPIIQMTMFRDT